MTANLSDESQSPWLTSKQSADHAGVSVRTVKRWIAAGDLEAHRLPTPGGKGPLRIRLNDLEAMLARCRLV